VAAYVLEHYAVSEDGISGKDFIGRARQLRWSELRSVRYGALMKWFRLESAGSVVRVSAMLTGLPEFAQLCLKRAPQAAIDAPTRAVLEATAAGNPPSVWA